MVAVWGWVRTSKKEERRSVGEGQEKEWEGERYVCGCYRKKRRTKCGRRAREGMRMRDILLQFLSKLE